MYTNIRQVKKHHIYLISNRRYILFCQSELHNLTVKFHLRFKFKKPNDVSTK